MKNTHSIDELKVGDVWMTVLGKVAIIECLHGSYTEYPFQVRFAGENGMRAYDFDLLDYKIS